MLAKVKVKYVHKFEKELENLVKEVAKEFKLKPLTVREIIWSQFKIVKTAKLKKEAVKLINLGTFGRKTPYEYRGKYKVHKRWLEKLNMEKQGSGGNSDGKRDKMCELQQQQT